MVDDIKNRPLDEIRAAYKKYLNTQNLSQNTVMTSSTDAFYIWRKKGQEAFWQIVLSDNFEVLGKSTLLELLVQQSSGNAEANLSGYMAHLRRFRRFLKTSGIEFSESKQNSSPAVSAVVNSQDPFILQESPYKFDVDKNGLLALTSGNVDRINFIIENDSNYRSDMDPENKESTYNYIRNHPYTRDYEVILGIVERIDIQNSTHQASSGVKQGDNRGREITAQFICDLPDFYERLKNEDAGLVNQIAGAIPGRYTFSFASKYCTYWSRYLLEADGYSIYDKILREILPYYAWVYIGENHMARKQSKIEKEFGQRNRGDYLGYRNLIDRIRREVECRTGYAITRKDFDHLLWYYYKGDADIKEKGSKILLHKSRTTVALEFVGNERSRLWI